MPAGRGGVFYPSDLIYQTSKNSKSQGEHVHRKLTNPKYQAKALLVIVYLGFISLGLPDTAFGVAWPFMRIDLGSPVTYAGIISFTITMLSSTAAFCSGPLIKRFGTGKLLVVCGFLTGTALILTSFISNFWILVALAIPLGIGAGSIDSGLNYYVASHYESRHMNWLHGCWGIGATIGPAMVTALIGLGLTWRAGYATLGAIQLTLACLFFYTLPLWTLPGGKITSDTAKQSVEDGKAKKDSRFWTSASMFFLYGGMEMSLGLWGYQLMVNVHGVNPKTAGFFVSCYWGGLMIGRFLTGFVSDKIGNRRLIQSSTTGAVLGGLTLIFSTSSCVALAALVWIGFSLAAFYPSMMHETPRRFDGPTTRTLMGFQSGAGALGFGLYPPLVGIVAARTTFGILPYVVVIHGLLLFIMRIVIDKGRE